MKKFLVVFLLTSIGHLLINCGKDELEAEPVVEHTYYAKYKITAGNNVHFCRFTLYYTDSDGQTSSKKYGENTSNFHGSKLYSDEIIVGPFKYNDALKLSISNTVSVTYYNLEIYISKDNSPFVLKKQANSSAVEYKIEF